MKCNETIIRVSEVVASKYYRMVPESSFQDVRQDIAIACIKAMEKYNPDKGSLFAYLYGAGRFAVMHMMDKMCRYRKKIINSDVGKMTNRKDPSPLPGEEQADESWRNAIRKVVPEIAGDLHNEAVTKVLLGESPQIVAMNHHLSPRYLANLVRAARKKAHKHQGLQSLRDDMMFKETTDA